MAVENGGFPPSTRFDLQELLSGPLDDAKCNVEAVDTANNVQLACILSDLMDTTFFRLFTVDLDRDCPFFNKAVPKPPQSCSSGGDDDAFSSFSNFKDKDPEEQGGCSLEPMSPFEPSGGGKDTSFARAGSKQTDEVDQSLSNRENKALATSSAITCDDESQPTFWLDMCDGIGVTGTKAKTVNLRKNPERWTGYNGSAVWQAIYEENCFRSDDDDDKSSNEKQLGYEQRLLYRLLSAMHTSINVHIALDHYPPRKGKRNKWEPNPAHFVERYADHPERIKNLHFAFVVLLRAVRKAGPQLLKMDYSTDNQATALPPDERGGNTRALVTRLLQTDLLASCNEVFGAFDETLLFQSRRDSTPVSHLKRHFKQVFRNVSQILDCVSCQKCKLHGKLSLLGLGTALKTLLLPPSLLDEGLPREEVVALINTLGKFSKAIQGVRDLSRMHQAKVSSNLLFSEQKRLEASSSKERNSAPLEYIEQGRKEAPNGMKMVPSPYALLQMWPEGYSKGLEKIEQAVKLIQSQKLPDQMETKLVDAALGCDPRIMILAKQYSKFPERFVQHALRALEIPFSSGQDQRIIPGYRLQDSNPDVYDLVVIGGGLTGLTAALTVLDGGGQVALIEKEPFLGGNSAWASSGINAAPVSTDPPTSDDTSRFLNDTLMSGHGDAQLAQALVNGSMSAIQWVEQRLDIKLNRISQLGGHSAARTRRSAGGMIGQELVTRISRIIKKFTQKSAGSEKPPLKLLTRSAVSKIEIGTESRSNGNEKRELSVYYSNTKTNETGQYIRARHVAMTTGGYANDRRREGLLDSYRPDLRGLPTTNGRWATGDGIYLAQAVGADVVDMDKVQVHPTAFLDLTDADAERKTLCAELLRGVGGILLTRSHQTERFVDELGPRDAIVKTMRETRDRLKSSITSQGEIEPGFLILLSDKMVKAAGKHAEHYIKKKLLVLQPSLAAVAKWANVSLESLETAINQYDQDAARAKGDGGSGRFGKRYFHNTPIGIKGSFAVGIVTPAIHYTMGGLRISPNASVLNRDGNAIPGLLAGGEATGGMHGKNRLGGNAMTECVVFGRIIGNQVLKAKEKTQREIRFSPIEKEASVADNPSSHSLPKFSLQDVKKHSFEEDCWVALYGKVYDFTDFLHEHPAGPEAILKTAGKDGTEEFEAIHIPDMLDDFDPIGILSA
eukprot:CAMPEP_0184483904 /NCGR_PEP_ID=MMETSP0113_2-20130426/5582_1 /TAXON_ID=91329 /ORGANISM="Norrisiella sphaerica, Strain BC52" /LENGTH=1180 /DNA_ID=CAMNT_0026864573 /DNA_START=183 /DNA_END=3725 /DNA_ORIENTATION=-